MEKLLYGKKHPYSDKVAGYRIGKYLYKLYIQQRANIPNIERTENIGYHANNHEKWNTELNREVSKDKIQMKEKYFLKKF